MSTPGERIDEARDEAREAATTACIACAQGWAHTHDDEDGES